MKGVKVVNAKAVDVYHYMNFDQIAELKDVAYRAREASPHRLVSNECCQPTVPRLVRHPEFRCQQLYVAGPAQAAAAALAFDEMNDAFAHGTHGQALGPGTQASDFSRQEQTPAAGEFRFSVESVAKLGKREGEQATGADRDRVVVVARGVNARLGEKAASAAALEHDRLPMHAMAHQVDFTVRDKEHLGRPLPGVEQRRAAWQQLFPSDHGQLGRQELRQWLVAFGRDHGTRFHVITII